MLTFLSKQHHTPVTPVTALCAEAREAAQKLLNHYVKVIKRNDLAVPSHLFWSRIVVG